MPIHREPARHKGNFPNIMTATTQELLDANDAMRAEYPNALILDAAFAADGFRLMMMPKGNDYPTEIGKGATVTEAMADLRAKIATHDPIAKLRAEAEKAGYVLTKMPTD
jgi:hypothetical protein